MNKYYQHHEEPIKRDIEHWVATAEHVVNGWELCSRSNGPIMGDDDEE